MEGRFGASVGSQTTVLHSTEAELQKLDVRALRKANKSENDLRITQDGREAGVLDVALPAEALQALRDNLHRLFAGEQFEQGRENAEELGLVFRQAAVVVPPEEACDFHQEQESRTAGHLGRVGRFCF